MISQIRAVSAAVATAVHCERSYARENLSVKERHAGVGRDVIKPGGSRSSTGAPPGRVGGYPPPEAQQIDNMLDAGTSQLNLATWPNNPNQRARAM